MKEIRLMVIEEEKLLKEEKHHVVAFNVCVSQQTEMVTVRSRGSSAVVLSCPAKRKS